MTPSPFLAFVQGQGGLGTSRLGFPHPPSSLGKASAQQPPWSFAHWKRPISKASSITHLNPSPNPRCPKDSKLHWEQSPELRMPHHTPARATETALSSPHPAGFLDMKMGMKSSCPPLLPSNPEASPPSSLSLFSSPPQKALPSLFLSSKSPMSLLPCYSSILVSCSRAFSDSPTGKIGPSTDPAQPFLYTCLCDTSSNLKTLG